MATDSPLTNLLVEQSPDAMIFADGDGIIRLWNPAAEAMFGHSTADAVGGSLDIIIPEQFREAHWKAYGHALDTGSTKYHGQSLPTRATKASGDSLCVELSFSLIRDRTGAMIGVLAHARDITERFEQERAYRRRLRELEQQAGTSREDGQLR